MEVLKKKSLGFVFLLRDAGLYFALFSMCLENRPFLPGNRRNAHWKQSITGHGYFCSIEDYSVNECNRVLSYWFKKKKAFATLKVFKEL